MSKAADSWPPEGQEILKRLKAETEQRKAVEEPHSDAAYMREAVEYADQIMRAALLRVGALPDGCPGKGEAALVAAFMQAAAAVMAANVIARSIEWAGSDR
jgi:hypothetical protein